MSKQSQGGRARAESLTAERRSEIAREAARARWQGREPDPEPLLVEIDDAMTERAMDGFALGWRQWPEVERAALRLGLTKALMAALAQ